MKSEEKNRRREFKAAWSEAVHTCYEGSLEDMVPLLDSRWPDVRSLVVRRMRKRGEAEVVPPLIALAAHEENDSVRLSVALALADLKDARATDALWTLVDEGPDPVRIAALRGLSRLGEDGVIPVAISWYQSGDRLLRANGVADLALLQTTNGEKALSDLVAAEPSWRSRRLIRRTVRRARRPRSRDR